MQHSNYMSVVRSACNTNSSRFRLCITCRCNQSIININVAIRRAKRGTVSAEPETISSIPFPLPESYTTTSSDSNERFLVYDNGSETACISILQSCRVRVAGRSRYVVHGWNALDSATTIRTAVLHPGATWRRTRYSCIRSPTRQEHYEEFLTAILDACLREDVRPSLSTVIFDYKTAIHNAVLSVISQNIKIQGCFYHLTQSTWRRIQNEGLQALYREDDAVRHFFGMLDGLAFLPTQLVNEGMAHLRTLAPEDLMPVVDYFDAMYLTGTYRMVMSEGKMRFRAVPVCV